MSGMGMKRKNTKESCSYDFDGVMCSLECAVKTVNGQSVIKSFET